MKQTPLISDPNVEGQEGAFCHEALLELEARGFDHDNLIKAIEKSATLFFRLLEKGRGVALLVSEEGEAVMVGLTTEPSDFLEPPQKT